LFAAAPNVALCQVRQNRCLCQCALLLLLLMLLLLLLLRSSDPIASF